MNASTLLFFSSLALFTGCDSDPGGTEDASLDAAAPVPVDITFELRIQNDMAESVFVQIQDANGVPAWVRVYREDGEPVSLRPHCGLPRCEGGSCGDVGPLVRDITSGEHFGHISMRWDGTSWEKDESGECLTPVRVLDGTFEAVFCHAWQTDPVAVEDGDQDGTLINPYCDRVTFSVPPASQDEATVSSRIIGG